MAYTMTCKGKRVIKEVPEYEQLRWQKIEANTRKLVFLGLPTLMAAIKVASNLER